MAQAWRPIIGWWLAAKIVPRILHTCIEHEIIGKNNFERVTYKEYVDITSSALPNNHNFVTKGANLVPTMCQAWANFEAIVSPLTTRALSVTGMHHRTADTVLDRDCDRSPW